jgi:hypothetical protein
MRTSSLPSAPAIALALLLLPACDLFSGTDDDGEPDDVIGAGGGGGSPPAGEGGGGIERSGVAVRHDQMPARIQSHLCDAQGHCDVDPATLYLVIEEGAGCVDPLDAEADPAAERFWLALSPAAQAVGQYPLQDGPVVLGNENGPVQAAAGSLIDVTAIDAGRVEVRTRGVFTPDSLFTFDRCDTTTKVDGLASPQDGDPNALRVVVTPGELTCSDPTRACLAGDDFWLQIDLANGELQEGTYDLATHVTGACELGLDEVSGELQVISADADQLVLRIHDLPPLPAALDRDLVVPVCP